MAKRKGRQRTTDGMAILKGRYLKGRPEREAMLAQVRADDAVGRKIFHLRTQAGLSQRELAKLIGTTASVICRLEDADYDSHSLAMLHRIAAALNKDIEINFVPRKHAA